MNKFILSSLLIAGSLAAAAQSPLPAPVAPANASAPTGTSLRAEETFAWSALTQTDATLKDINNKEYKLQEIMAQGKFILIDFSAIWCGWCWDPIHTQGMMEKIYSKYGPAGTGEVELFWIEADPANDAQEAEGLYGPVNGSKGDWTKTIDGKPNPVPIVSNGALFKTLFGVDIASYPTLMLLSPDGLYLDVTNFFLYGGFNTEGVEGIKKRMESAPDKNSVPEIKGLYGRIEALKGNPVRFTIDYVSALPDVTIEWHFNGADKETSNEKAPRVTFTQVGEQLITCTVSNANGKSKTIQATIQVAEPWLVNWFPFEENFNDAHDINIQWRVYDFDADGYTWTTLQQWMVDVIGITSEKEAATLALEGNNSLVSWSRIPTFYDPSKGWETQNLKVQNNYLVSPKISLPNSSEPATLLFTAKSFGYVDFDDLQVLVSTTDPDTPTAFTKQVTSMKALSSTGSEYRFDLSEFKGQDIYIAFVHPNELGFGLILDKISVWTKSNVGVDAPQNGEVVLVPNAHTTRIVGADLVSAQVYTIDGALLAGYELSGTQATIPTPAVSGKYVVRVTTAHGVQSAQLLVP